MSAGQVFPFDVFASYVAELKAGAGDWHALLAEQRFAELKARERWFSDRQKGMFYRLLSPSRRGSFLEIQAGSGIVSACLSEDYGSGYALERRALLADFIECRFRSDRVLNVDVVRVHGREIPLENKCVDLVAIDGPISTGQEMSGGSSPEAAVAETLREALRCLRPHGCLIMAVDNAWHVPRPLTAAEQSGNFGSDAGQMRRRSPIGYRRLLRRAGFRNPRLFVVKTRRQLPIDIYSYHRDALEQLYRKYDSRSRVSRLIKWASDLAGLPYLAANFQPSFYLVGER